MLPTREEAEALLREAEQCNPGPWGDHSRTAAHCAEAIAAHCPGLDPDKAYILGLLHDIGRRFGVRHLGHVYDGYAYMTALGYDEVARVCLTHSFHRGSTDDYIGRFDTTPDEQRAIEEGLRVLVPDEYDRLIQLCDALAGSEGVVDIEERMADVRRRYGTYPPEKWAANMALKSHFEEIIGGSIYAVTEKDTYRPGGPGKEENRVEVRRIDKQHEADIRLPNEPFRLFGRVVPTYADGRFACEVVRFAPGDVTQMTFPEENYVFDDMKDSVFLGAYDGGRCVGLAILQPGFFRYMYLSDLKVATAYRGRHIGRMLMDRAKETARQAGYAGLYTICQDNNPGAFLFYRQCGFSVGGLDTCVYRHTAQEGKTDLYLYAECAGEEEDAAR